MRKNSSAPVVHRGEADLVDDEVGQQDLLDHRADGVDGQAPLEGLHQIGGAEVADLQAGVDGVAAEPPGGGTCPSRADRPKQRFSLAPIHSRLVR